LEVKAYFFQLDIVTELSASGAFAESSATWRWAFYINLVVGGIFAPVYIFLLPPFDPRPNQKYAKRIREFDHPGALLSIAALVSIIMAINFGGTLYAWDSGQIIA
jgi:MFS family permease